LSPALDLSALVRSQQVIVCCGSGGVGKTTSAAALGVLAAKQGRRVQVMTIDPARRLAQAMGLETLTNDPQPVPLAAEGELSALMLDSKRTFDRLVETYAPSDRAREAILANNYYQQLSTSLGGSRELVAMERVLEAVNAGSHDLLVVDTPPSHHALDFLEAPRRIVNLLEGSLTRALVRPYGLAARAQFNFFRQSSAAALKFMERLTGVEMLADLSDFLLAFSSMFEGFKERSHQVQALMKRPGTSFLLVCAPEPGSLRQVNQFAERLNAEGMAIAGVLANRVSPDPGWQGGSEAAALSATDAAEVDAYSDRLFASQPLSRRICQSLDIAVALHAADMLALNEVSRGQLPLHTVPRFDHDLHSMADLEAFADRLLPGQPQP
jgi:anion-transporting  ArsA/GET3 family ATPase